MAIFNMVGGGSGGGIILPTDAILRVIAPAGSTVTITKGLVTKSDAGHENASDTSLYDYYFIIHASQFDSVNPWTVTATLGTKTKSASIIIDTSDEYDLILRFGFYLVVDGLLTNDITKSAGTITQYTGFVTMTAGNGEMAFTSTDPIDVTDFSSAVIEVVGQNSASAYDSKHPILALGKSRPSYSGSNVVASTHLNSATGIIPAGVYTLDISSYVGDYYIGVLLKYIGSNNYGRIDVSRFGVE